MVVMGWVRVNRMRRLREGMIGRYFRHSGFLFHLHVAQIDKPALLLQHHLSYYCMWVVGKRAGVGVCAHDTRRLANAVLEHRRAATAVSFGLRPYCRGVREIKFRRVATQPDAALFVRT